MEKKYLPIGSVCTIKGQAKKIMITGYYSVEYNGNLKIKDYSGCFYPEGMLLPNSVISFNHSEIENIDFLGYKNEENEKFQANLNKLTGNAVEAEADVAASDQTYTRIVFDENGVVTLLEPVAPQATDNSNEEVIDEVENPFFKEYDDKPAEEEKSDLKFTKIRFDENGRVIALDDVTEEEKQKSLNDIKVEEKVEVEEEPTPTPAPQPVEKTTLDTIEFDENGNIVGV